MFCIGIGGRGAGCIWVGWDALCCQLVLSCTAMHTLQLFALQCTLSPFATGCTVCYKLQCETLFFTSCPAVHNILQVSLHHLRVLFWAFGLRLTTCVFEHTLIKGCTALVYWCCTNVALPKDLRRMAPPVSAQPADHQEQPDQQLLDKLYKHKQLDKHKQFDN